MISVRCFPQHKIALDIFIQATEPLEADVTGIDSATGIPRVVTLTDSMVRDALDGPVNAIVEAIRLTLSRSSPELASDIRKRGIVLTGGGSLLKGLGTRLHRETRLPIYRAKDPLKAIVKGTGYVLDNLSDLKKVCFN